jgi:hypothetical protein
MPDLLIPILCCICKYHTRWTPNLSTIDSLQKVANRLQGFKLKLFQTEIPMIYSWFMQRRCQQRRMVEWSVNTGLRRVWNRVVVTYFKYYPEICMGLKKTTKNLLPGHPALGPRFASGIPIINIGGRSMLINSTDITSRSQVNIMCVVQIWH